MLWGAAEWLTEGFFGQLFVNSLPNSWDKRVPTTCRVSFGSKLNTLRK